MDMTGEHEIKAPRQVVWAALNDPEALKQSIDGVEELNKISDHEFEAQVVAKVGPVKAKFKGKITLSDLDPPNGYTITGEGQGGAAGFAKGGAKVQLADAPGGATTLRYQVHAQIGGKLAQIGSRLIDGAARKMAEEFFTAFSGVVEARAAAAPSATASETAPAPAAQPSAAVAQAGAPSAMPPKQGLPPAVWIGGIVVAAGVVVWLILR
ncbi:MAG TPA: carbon monoxide dehydrogenase subunit G [Candidatus Cybelea sp.]|nr:carbon monoxide dehydrogenase subunit G [Candidatus Cybelea sp.]